MVSLKNGVSDRGGLSIARVVLEISWSEVSLDGGSAGSALIITALGLAILVIGPSGLTNPGTQVVLFMVGVGDGNSRLPHLGDGKKEVVSQPW